MYGASRHGSAQILRALADEPLRRAMLPAPQDRRIVFASEAFPFPSGGVAVIYQHAELLARHGYRAMVALAQRPVVDFYGIDAPLWIHGGALAPEPGDIWVLPEGFKPYAEVLAFSPVTLLMFCQNQYYLPFGADPRAGFHREFGVDGVIASSESVRQFLQEVYGLIDVPLIPCAVDASRYAPAASKSQQVAFMPRKLGEEAAFLHHLLRRLHPRHADVPWVPIQGRTQRDAAAQLAQSSVFLSLSHKESFGLPPLEAMASGCLVAGFHGDGGREYMTAANGWWAETGDWRACVAGLAAALDLAAAPAEASTERRAAMAETVARYSPACMEAALLGFWASALREPVAPRRGS